MVWLQLKKGQKVLQELLQFSSVYLKSLQAFLEIWRRRIREGRLTSG